MPNLLRLIRHFKLDPREFLIRVIQQVLVVLGTSIETLVELLEIVHVIGLNIGFNGLNLNPLLIRLSMDR